MSAHSGAGLDCAGCHGEGHTGADDVDRLETITAETCGTCHEPQWQQFARGKHAMAWRSMRAMPTIHWKPLEQTSGMEGCGGCHKIGLKTEAEIRQLKEGGGGFGVGGGGQEHHTRETNSGRRRARMWSSVRVSASASGSTSSLISAMRPTMSS